MKDIITILQIIVKISIGEQKIKHFQNACLNESLPFAAAVSSF